jgi:hypothetical protein
MGETAAETVREIEATRHRLDEEIRQLEERLPAPAVWGKRLVGVALGGGVGGTAFWYLLRRLRRRRAEARRPLTPPATVQLVPDRWAESVGRALESGRWRLWVAGGAAVWVLLRAVELRQLRRVSRALAATWTPR